MIDILRLRYYEELEREAQKQYPFLQVKLTDETREMVMRTLEKSGPVVISGNKTSGLDLAWCAPHKLLSEGVEKYDSYTAEGGFAGHYSGYFTLASGHAVKVFVSRWNRLPKHYSEGGNLYLAGTGDTRWGPQTLISLPSSGLKARRPHTETDILNPLAAFEFHEDVKVLLDGAVEILKEL